MNAVLKIFLSMSFSGSLLILALLLGKRFLKDKISRQWQYYIWLVVVLRLLFPFGPEVSLLGKTYQAVDQAITRTASLPPQQQSPLTVPEENLAPAVGMEQSNGNMNSPTEDITTARPFQETGTLLTDHVWLIWLAAALVLLIRKATIYQSFMRYIKAGLTPVSDVEILDRFFIAAGQAGIKRPVELCVNPLISSPLLTGFFHPCIVLPDADISEKAFPYIVLHELTHYKRRDMFYKWLVQITVCLHWFNPLVHLMSREITKACEFSCDEAVLAKMGCDNAQDYGKILLDAMAAVGKYKENLGSVTLSENKQLLKERLDAIMKFQKPTGAVRLLTAVLTAGIVLGASFVGVYTAGNVQAASLSGTTPDAAGRPSLSLDVSSAAVNVYPNETGINRESDISQLERYYNAGSLPLFQIAFPRLEKEEQLAWLEKIYADGNIAFFSAAVRGLDTDISLITGFAEKVYENADIAFFSILADSMDETELEFWLDRALEDENWAFQSMLFDKLGKKDEFDELEAKREKEWVKTQMAEYEAAGVTMVDEKTYYYQGQLVNIFLDVRKEGSFYTLNMNPAGTVNIKITRDADNHIAGVACMTEAEVVELLEDMDDPDEPLKDRHIGRSVRITKEELSDELGEIIDSCDMETWYVIERNGYQYIYFGGLPDNYAYQPEIYTDCDSGTVNIFDADTSIGKTGYVLLEIQQNVTLTIYYNGTQISYTEL